MPTSCQKKIDQEICQMFLLIGISVSIIFLVGIFIIIKLFYFRKKDTFEKSKKADDHLKKIDFKQKNDKLIRKMKERDK